ncbi:hypothetical protein EVAR_92504_1 [Eumeta japonica]|uniref:Uncharacterized protein n=1 Tax=Eumeta variegata TaxID=151549 RepID=A0A4C1T762_EUMVA|nr:hypothetical protein EVAR_92504_1 [Eumeta japonica]
MSVTIDLIIESILKVLCVRNRRVVLSIEPQLIGTEVTSPSDPRAFLTPRVGRTLDRSDPIYMKVITRRMRADDVSSVKKVQSVAETNMTAGYRSKNRGREVLDLSSSPPNSMAMLSKDMEEIDSTDCAVGWDNIS